MNCRTLGVEGQFSAAWGHLNKCMYSWKCWQNVDIEGVMDMCMKLICKVYVRISDVLVCM